MAQQLMDVEIATPEELVRLGSKEAWKRLHAVNSGTWTTMLIALEGAVTGQRLKEISEEKKIELRSFVKEQKQLAKAARALAR